MLERQLPVDGMRGALLLSRRGQADDRIAVVEHGETADGRITFSADVLAQTLRKSALGTLNAACTARTNKGRHT